MKSFVSLISIFALFYPSLCQGGPSPIPMANKIPKNGLYSNSILGHSNIIQGTSNYNAIFGIRNYMLGNNNGIFGNGNKVQGQGNIVGQPDD